MGMDHLLKVLMVQGLPLLVVMAVGARTYNRSLLGSADAVGAVLGQLEVAHHTTPQVVEVDCTDSDGEARLRRLVDFVGIEGLRMMQEFEQLTKLEEGEA